MIRLVSLVHSYTVNVDPQRSVSFPLLFFESLFWFVMLKESEKDRSEVNPRPKPTPFNGVGVPFHTKEKLSQHTLRIEGKFVTSKVNVTGSVSARRFKVLYGRERELVHLSVPLNPGIERLVWFFNGRVLESGDPLANSLQVAVTSETEGFYLCSSVSKDGQLKRLLVGIVRLRKNTTEHFAPKSLILPGVILSGLILPGSHCDCYDDAVKDNNPPGTSVHLCAGCEHRENIFLTVYYHKLHLYQGARHLLTTEVCATCARGFTFQWIHNGQDLQHSNQKDLLICAQPRIDGMYVCVATSSQDPYVQFSSTVYHVVVSVVQEPVEETCTIARCPEIPSSMAQPHLPQHHRLDLVPASPPGAQQLPQGDSVPTGPSLYCFSQMSTLLLYSRYFLSPDFNFALLERSEGCYEAIRGIIHALLSTPLEESSLVRKFFEMLVSDDTTEIRSGLRCCDQRVYELIWSLMHPSCPEFFHEVGSCLLENIHLPPYIMKWRPPGGQYQHRAGTTVLLQVQAYNVDTFRWECDGSSIECIHAATTLDSSNLSLTVTDESCGRYRCVAFNRHGSSCTPPCDIAVDHTLPCVTSSPCSPEVSGVVEHMDVQPPAYLVTRLSESCVSQDEGKLCPGISIRERAFTAGVLCTGINLKVPPRLEMGDAVVLPPLPIKSFRH